MYHDQGQIALKLMGFSRGVTVQGGLPIPVTTPAHGTAYDIAGQGKANPCALLLGAGQMLDHLGMAEKAERLRGAIVATLEARDSLTGDLGGNGSTMAFAKAIASRV